MANIKVAIVDDNERMVEILTHVLKGNPEFSVVGTARDGMGAMELINQKKPDVVLLDLLLTKLDGLSVMERITAARSAETERSACSTE